MSASSSPLSTSDPIPSHSSGRYRLPASLGGKVVNGQACQWNAGTVTAIAVSIDGEQVTLPSSLLVEVCPPQPIAGWVTVPSGTDVPNVFYRSPTWEPNRWRFVNVGVFLSWEEVCAHGDLIHLVVKKSEYGRCAVCGELKPVRTDGMVKNHGPRNRPCRGSDRSPKAEAKADE